MALTHEAQNGGGFLPPNNDLVAPLRWSGTPPSAANECNPAADGPKSYFLAMYRNAKTNGLFLSIFPTIPAPD